MVQKEKKNKQAVGMQLSYAFIVSLDFSNEQT